MGNRIRAATVRPIRLTPTEAELAVKVEADAPAADADVHGRLVGPRCKYGSMVEVAYPVLRLPPETGGPAARLGKVIIPEPSWWDPESPFLYGGPVELWEGGQTVGQVRVRVGLHHATAAGGRLLWNGRPLDLRAVAEPDAIADRLPEIRSSGANLVVVEGEPPAELLDAADEVGVLVAGRVADAARRAAARVPFHHSSLLGYFDAAGEGGSLVLTAGRGVLEFDVQ